jgi:primary-amine oxidase
MVKSFTNGPTRRRFNLSLLPPFPLFVTCFLVLAVIFFSLTQHGRHITSQLPSIPSSTKIKPEYRPHSDAQKHGGRLRETTAPRKSPWKELSKAEVDSVVKVVQAKGHDIGVPKDAGIAFVERLMPNKTDTVPYLEKKGLKEVDGWARVVMVQPHSWGGKQGGVSEWMVGPLPVGSETDIFPLSYIYTAGRNHIRRPIPNIEEILIWFNGVVTGPLRDIMSDLLGEIPDFTTMSKTPGLMALASPDIATDESKLAAWLTVYPPSDAGLRDAFSLLSQGLYAHLEIFGMESKEWHVTDWFYNGVLYNSTEAFRDSWESGTLKKSQTNPDGSWTNAEPIVEGIEGREFAAPILVQPYGPRVEVDEKEKYVKWMGWEFYISFSQVTALGLHDIKFKGERIIYELGMQEAMAQYAGASPTSSGQLFFDTLFGFGLNTYELIPGYDCPTYATFLPISMYREGKLIKRKNAICVFEAVSDHPLQRHTTGQKVTASRNSYLVVRAVSTVGNYDYTVSYIFYLDGAVEVKVHASGYIFSDYLAIDTIRRDVATSRETQQFEYGYRIHDVVSSLMHTHELSFKADLDIAGTANTLYKVTVEPSTRTYEWEPEVKRSTMHLVHTPISREAGLDWPRNSQGIYVVMNNESTNSWGEKRGYKIVPGTGMGTPPHLATINSTSAGRAAAWAEHDLWVLRQHDTEPRGASEWNAWEIADPLINFGDMVNDESTVQEDLVVYFNLGVHHLSNSADIPNTLMHWSGTSVMFIPHNYLDRDASRESAQGVRLIIGEAGVEEVTYFGARYDKDVFIRKVRTPKFTNSWYRNGKIY